MRYFFYTLGADSNSYVFRVYEIINNEIEFLKELKSNIWSISVVKKYLVAHQNLKHYDSIKELT